MQNEPDTCALRWRRCSIISGLFLSILLTHLQTASSADTLFAPPISVNGSRIPVNGLERNNSVFVPVRGYFEKLGASVSSHGSSIVAMRGASVIAHLTVGNRDASFNGASRQLAVAPFISHGSVMLPLRALSEASGATVAYQSDPSRVNVLEANRAPVATVAQVAPVATDAAAAPAADPQTNQSGMPWWAWLLLAILILGLIFFFVSRRKKEPIITTRK